MSASGAKHQHHEKTNPILGMGPLNSNSMPTQVPRVKSEGQENYMKNRGSLNIGDWYQEGKTYQSARPVPRIKSNEAKNTYIQSQGSMALNLGGYVENEASAHKGPRVKQEGQENFFKNRGTLSFNPHENNHGEYTPPQIARVKFEGNDNRALSQGSMGQLFGKYGRLPLDEKPVPRVKYEANEYRANGNGSSMGKAMSMVPPSSRPSSTTFFRSS